MPWPHSLWSISIDSIARNWLTRKSLNARRFCLVEPALYTEISGTWESSGHFPAEVGAASHFVPTLEFPFFLPSEICCPEPWNHCCLKTGDPRAKHGSCCNNRFIDHSFLQCWILWLISGYSWQRAVTELCLLQLSREPACTVLLQGFVCTAFLERGSNTLTWRGEVQARLERVCVCTCVCVPWGWGNMPPLMNVGKEPDPHAGEPHWRFLSLQSSGQQFPEDP